MRPPSLLPRHSMSTIYWTCLKKYSSIPFWPHVVSGGQYSLSCLFFVSWPETHFARKNPGHYVKMRPRRLLSSQEALKKQPQKAFIICGRQSCRPCRIIRPLPRRKRRAARRKKRENPGGALLGQSLACPILLPSRSARPSHQAPGRLNLAPIPGRLKFRSRFSRAFSFLLRISAQHCRLIAIKPRCLIRN